MSGSDRAQAYTLEGLIAAILIASAVLYGLQAVDVAPYAEDRSDRDLDAFRTQVDDALNVLGDSGELRKAVTCLNTTAPSGSDALGKPHVRVGQPPDGNTSDNDGNVTDLGYVLNETLGYDNRPYIVVFDYWNATRAGTNATIVYPSGVDENLNFTREPVTATYRVSIYESTRIYRPQTDPRPGVDRRRCRPTDDRVADVAGTERLYLPRGHSTSDRELYNQVTVRVITW